MIAHYALLPPDPTTQAHLVVITAANPGPVSLSIAGHSVPGDSAQIPSRSEWIHHFRVSGLRPGTPYGWEIAGVGAGLPLRTLPGAMPAGGLVGVALSDIHTNGAGMAAPSEMDVVAAQAPDFCLLVGDYANSFREAHGAVSGGFWVEMFRDYMARLSGETLVPILAIPGNHDVGNHQWDGTGAVNPGGTYFRVFFPNIADMAPAGTNYAAPALGDWLQVLAVDSHSTTTAETAAWLPGQIAPDMPLCLPIVHSPMFAANIRGGNDPVLQARLRDALFALVHRADNAVFGVCGHIHAQTRTRPLGLVGAEPGGSAKMALGAQWIVEDPDGYVEVGQGYQNDRPGAATQPWFLEEAEGGRPTFQRIDLAQGSVRLRTIDQVGNAVYTRVWVRPRSRRSQAMRGGKPVTPIRGGAPVYLKRSTGLGLSPSTVIVPGNGLMTVESLASAAPLSVAAGDTRVTVEVA